MYASGTVDIDGTWYCDLDLGLQVSDVTGDLWWEMYDSTTRWFTPLPGAELAVMGTTPVGYSECAAATLSAAQIDASGAAYGLVPVGTWLCGRTGEGRLAAFQVTAYDAAVNHRMTLDFTTWE